MVVSLAACAGNETPTETSTPDTESSAPAESTVQESSEIKSEPESEPVTDSQPEETEITVDSDIETTGLQVLIAYFSATGTTEGVAGNIASGLDADLYEIVPEQPYTDADLNYNDDNSCSSVEMNDPASRPAIAAPVENMAQYDTVFVGFHIWWYEAPRIVQTFLESYDLSGKTIVPFCTSGGSGLGKAPAVLQKSCPGAKMVSGKRLSGSASASDLSAWVKSLDL